MRRRFAFVAVLIAFAYSPTFAADEGPYERYSEAIKLDPTKAGPYIGRGNVSFGRGEFDMAIKDFTEAIKLDRKNSYTYYLRGGCWASKGEFDKAIKDYDGAIWLDPKNAVAFTFRGNAWASKGEFDKAIQDHAEAIKLDPKEATAYNNYAWLRATCPDERYRDGHKAVADATTACELTAWKDGHTIDTLAAAFAELGDFPNALIWQEKAIELAATEVALQEMATHLDLYKAGKPFREAPKM